MADKTIIILGHSYMHTYAMRGLFAMEDRWIGVCVCVCR